MQTAAADPRTDASAEAAERELLAALQRCDEAAFVRFVDAQHGALVRFASLYMRGLAAAEALAQETWGEFVAALPDVPAHARPKAQLFRALLACARAHPDRAVADVPLSASADDDAVHQPSVEASRFMTEGVWAGGWAAPPRNFGEDVERDLTSGALRQQLGAALSQLPPAQHEVVALRDVEGFSAAEVCDLLGLSEPRQRLLLHHGRARLRAAIEQHLLGAS